MSTTHCLGDYVSDPRMLSNKHKRTLISVALIGSVGSTVNSHIYPPRWVILSLCLISETAKEWNRFPFCTFLMYMCLCVYVPLTHRDPQRPAKGIGSCKAGVTGRCELPAQCGHWEPSSGLLEEQQGLFIAEPSLSPGNHRTTGVIRKAWLRELNEKMVKRQNLLVDWFVLRSGTSPDIWSILEFHTFSDFSLYTLR